MKPFLLFLGCCCYLNAHAIVKYDEGNLIINGVLLFQDREVAEDYYYLPPYPKVATKQDGSLEILFLKYVGEGGEATNGGIFHALVEFSLTEEELTDLEKELRKRIPEARIRGPVPMQEAVADGESGIGSFRIISAVLNDTGGDVPFTRNVISSGHAPLLPGSKAALAANLSQHGATLLWESFQSSTSDVSIAIDAYFEAAVKGYNAIVEAETEMLYEHFSELQNIQGGFSRHQTRKIVDSLVQAQAIRVDVFDRSASTGISSEDMQKIVDLITTQLIGLMFDVENGWAKIPQLEAPADGEIKNRYKRGGVVGFFFGPGRQAYIPDNQYVLKERKDIRSFRFYMNLSKSTTIKVPVHTAGNIQGLFNLDEEEGRYFRIVNLDDPDFQKRQVHFQVDGEFAEGFNDIINFVSVNFRKEYGTARPNESSDTSLIFNKADLVGGQDLKSVSYPRLGLTGPDWLDYAYRVTWSVKGLADPITVPPERSNWSSSNMPSIPLTPPFRKRVVEMDADRNAFKSNGIRAATVRFFVILGGQAMPQKSITLRDDDAVNTNLVSLYHDRNEPVAYKVSWYSPRGEYHEDIKVLDGEYLFLLPPDPEKLKK